MTRPRSLLVLRLASLVSLGASTAGLVDFYRPQPAFCTVGSACEKIKQLGYGAVAGVPVVAIGFGCFLSLYLLSLSPQPLARRLTVLGGLIGGVTALGLIVFQIILVGSFCKICITVDSSAIIAAISAALLARSGEARHEPWSLVSWLGLLIGAIGVPWGISELKPPAPVPPAIAGLWRPGSINVIEFSDFECPYCRLAHPALEAAVQGAKKPVHFVRKSMPLPSHPHARDASRAWVCASAQGKGDAMADKLFTQEDLSKDAIASSAASLGLAMDAFKACTDDPATDRAIDKDVALVRSADFQGLPTVWIDGERILGAHPQADYAAALDRAASGGGAGANVWPLASALALAAGLLLWGMKPTKEEGLEQQGKGAGGGRLARRGRSWGSR